MLQHNIEFSDKNNIISDIDRKFICEILPKRSTKIFKTEFKNDLQYITVHTNCKTKEDIKSWISEYEDNTATSYSITQTKDCTGKYVIFKQFLRCHHNTRHKSIYVYSKSSTKNTKCPAAITVTLCAYKNKRKERDLERAEKAKLPCIINLILTHNHGNDASALKYRKVSAETREELLELFKNGHSPATALKLLKSDILSNEQALSDRKYCPDYNFCYYMYMKIFKQRSDSILRCETISEKQQPSKEQLAIDGLSMLDEITQTIRSHIMQSPEQMVPALRRMCKNMKKLRSSANVAAAYFNFANEKTRPEKIIHVSRTEICRKKLKSERSPGQHMNIV